MSMSGWTAAAGLMEAVSRCFWCGGVTGLGTWQPNGWFKCHECAARQVDFYRGAQAQAEAARLLAVEAEVAERCAMLDLDG